ncbi:Lar family restriction alleviation protein [Alteromonas macleodii]|jgi:Lar family restriction alleviation protein|uniref:Lar family restriction alleviation protein n=1 Tax=Alteromonas macleodii TaxID=28108 RepID=UPI0039F668CF
MKPQNELKPCPFCGNSDVHVDGVHLAFAPLHRDNHTVNAFIRCEKCPCSMHMQFDSKQKDWRNVIAAAWNQRMEGKPRNKEKRNVNVASSPTEVTHQTDLFGVL